MPVYITSCYDSKMSKKVLISISLGITLLILLCLFFVYEQPVGAPSPKETNPLPITNSSVKTPETFDKTKYSLTDSTSIWAVVNKKRPLPKGFIPTDLTVPNVALRLAPSAEQMKIRLIAQTDLMDMFSSAKNEAVNLVFGSGFRSESYQKQLYEQYSSQSGQAQADTFSARPGYSEHQSGLAFDATAGSGKCPLEICFETTPEGIWIMNNAYRYGFVIRYQKGKEPITGYRYEPWHLRYVGKELASELNKTGQTLEEFFGLENATQY